MSEAEVKSWTSPTEIWQIIVKCSSLDQNLQLRVLKDLRLRNTCDWPLQCVSWPSFKCSWLLSGNIILKKPYPPFFSITQKKKHFSLLF